MRARLSCAACTILALLLGILILRYLTGYWLFSFFYSLQTHIGIAVIAGSLACLLIGSRRTAGLLLLAAVVVTAHSLLMKREFLPKAQVPPPGAENIRLLSFNILGDNFQNGARIVDMITASGADVAFVFEAAPLIEHLSALSAIYPYRIGCGVIDQACDLLILSKRPMLKQTMERLSDLRGPRFGVADIEVGGTLVHFAAAHLTKPYFDDYHTQELRKLRAYMRKTGGTFVLGGDFNSGSIAPDMQYFLRRTELQTSGVEPATWPAAAGRLGIAIDHIYVSRSITPLSLQRMEDDYGSNHYGLIADIAIGG